MAPIPKNSINHFIHPAHPLKSVDLDQEYLCDGCKTPGSGKRYRCHGCDFDLHEYCGTCPVTLNSYMHKHHALTLVVRKAAGARQVDRICDVCTEPVEGLFYRCKACEFDVHPLCTQLPEQLSHALHKAHPLSLASPKSAVAGVCYSVCRKSSHGWHYSCKGCNFDIHLECVLVPTVPCPESAETKHRGIRQQYYQGIPYQPPPQFVPYYYPGYHHGPGVQYNSGYHHGPGVQYNPDYHHGPGYHQYNPQNMYPPQNAVGSSNNNGQSRLGKSMFSLVGQLGFGVLSNMIFGVDLSPLF